MENYIIEIIATAGFALVSWFCRSVLTRLDAIKSDLHEMAERHGERIARLEVQSHAKRCEGYEFRRRYTDD